MSSIKLDMDSVTGNDKGVLSGCNFVPVGSGKYHFRQSSGTIIKPNVSDSVDFDFSLNGFTWNVTGFKINDTEASGNWKNNDPSPRTSGGVIQNDETGTFHAQAGGVRVPPPADAIIINEVKIVTGRPIRGGRLFGCYFVQDVNGHNFFDRDGNLLQSQIQNGVPFPFSFPINSKKPEWQMTVNFDNADLAHGDWNFDGKDDELGNHDAADEEDGTFHAQAGGGGMEHKKASYATAY